MHHERIIGLARIYIVVAAVQLALSCNMDCLKKQFEDYLMDQAKKPSTTLFAREKMELIRRFLLGG